MTRRRPWTRALCLALGASGIAWAGAAALALPDERAGLRVGGRLALGEDFRPEILRAWADRLDGAILSTCDTHHLTGALFVLLRAAETERVEGDLAAFDRRLEAARGATIRTLACMPEHAYAWLALYWIESLRRGFSPELLRLLEQSYRTGPRETWIAVRRNPLAMSLFPILPPALQELAIDEFVDLVHTTQFDTAVRLFAIAEPDVQARIVPRLAEVPFGTRRGFQQRLLRLGIDVTLPGLDPPKERRPFH